MGLRVVFMGTPQFAVPSLHAISEKHQVLGVYTQPDRSVGRGLSLRPSAVKLTALKLGLPVFQPEKLSLPGEFEQLCDLRPDVIVVVAYGQILKKNVLNFPRLGCINVHSSLLPRWRGAAPIQWALLSGDSESGVSTMQLVEKLDAGPVFLQVKTLISERETFQTLHDRLAEIGAQLVLPTLLGLEEGSLHSQVQDESQVKYASRLTKEMERLDPRETAFSLDCRVRALNPWPGTSVQVGERLKIRQAQFHPEIQGPVGKIFERTGMVLLGTSQGSLELIRLQWEGKKEVGPSQFLNGLKGRGQSLPLDLD